MKSLSRRRFLTSAAAGVAALILPTTRVVGANATLNVGCIGTGGFATGVGSGISAVASSPI